MRARLSRYKWELWLLIGIPFLVHTAYYLSTLVLQFVGWVSYAELFVAIPTRMLLLSASYYLWIRHLDREFLVPLWGYLIVVSAIGFVEGVVISVNIAIYGPELWVLGVIFESGLGFVKTPLGLFLLFMLLSYLVLLWFARKLSRTGLSYAFFLVVFAALYLDIVPKGHPAEPTIQSIFYMYYLTPLIVGSVVLLIKVWLLGNFDRRDERFRRMAIIVLAVTLVLDIYARLGAGALFGYMESFATTLPIPPGLFGMDVLTWMETAIYEDIAAFIAAGLFNVVVFFLLFGVVYLIRVRKEETSD